MYFYSRVATFVSRQSFNMIGVVNNKNNQQDLNVQITTILKIRIFFGFYHNVFDNSIILRLLLKVILIVFGAAILYTGTQSRSKEFSKLNHFIKALEYITYFVLTLTTENSYLLRYFRHDPIIDTKRSNQAYQQVVKFTLSFLLLTIVYYVSLYSVVTYAKYVSNSGYVLEYISLIFFRLSSELGRIPVLMVLLLFYYRMKLFSSFVQEAALNTTSTFNLKRYIVMYSRNLDSLKETDGCVKPMIFVHLISSFVNTLVLFYNVVITLYKSVSSLDTLFFLIGTSIQVIYNCLILFIPSVIIELITKDLEALKNDLADRILTCGDRRRREQLRMLQLYLHDKPFTYTLWRSIQVNSRLPLKFLSLVATCLICMLQISVKNK